MFTYTKLRSLNDLIYFDTCLKFHLELSLLKSYLARVGVLSPMEYSTYSVLTADFPGIAFGIIRNVPSVSCSMRHSSESLPENLETDVTSISAVAARALSVPSIVILKY